MSAVRCFAAHGDQRVEVWSGIQIAILGGRRQKQKIPLRRRPLMAAVHRHDAVTQGIYARLYALPAPVPCRGREPEHAEQRTLGYIGQRHIRQSRVLFPHPSAGWKTGAQPNPAISGALIADLKSVLLQSLSDAGCQLRWRSSGPVRFILLPPEHGGRKEPRPGPASDGESASHHFILTIPGQSIANIELL